MNLTMTLPQARPGFDTTVVQSTSTPAGTSSPSIDLREDTGSSTSPWHPSVIAEPALGGDEPGDDTLLNRLPTLAYVGRYALKHQLGQGGLGTVYAAIDPLLSRPIAVKTLRVDKSAERAQREAFETMLLAEARAAAGLNHPAIVTVFDAGLSEHGVYIAMERLKGHDLRERLTLGWRPTPWQAAQLVARVADALDYAHRMGVVHCDVKPGNIFLASDRDPKLLDFGIAKVAAAAGVDIALDTAPLDALSPYYAAPEQIQGGAVDARTDIYALGVVLHELLARKRPYQGDSIQALEAAVLRGDAPSADRVAHGVPPQLAHIAARAMARDPKDRYRNALQMANALHRCLDAAAPKARATRRLQALALTVACVGVAATAWQSLAPYTRDEPTVQTSRSTPASTTTATSDVAPSSFLGQPLPRVLMLEAALPTLGFKHGFDDLRGWASGAAHSLAAKITPPPRNHVARTPAKASRSDAAKSAATIVTGEVNFAVAPWGQIEVNGQDLGATPPLTRLTLPEGTHQVVVRNGDLPAYTTTIVVDAQRASTVRHRFGS